jgi:septin family protein
MGSVYISNQWDRDALLALSAVAVVIPVVTRADSLTRAEATALRESLGQQLRRAGLSLMDPVLLSAAAAAGGGDDMDLPLVVAAGAQLDAGQPVRRYA